MIADYLVENTYIGVKRCKHGLFIFNKNDTFVGRGLDIYGEWCESEIETLSQLLRPGHTVIDVGANIGTHTVAFANLVGPTGTVHAFEPQRRLFQMLCGNVALNELENVYCHQKCVSSAAAELLIPELPPPTRAFNFAAVPIGGGTKGEMVPAVTIDNLGLTACNLIKIDVEGMEADVIMGATDTIARFRPILFVENNTTKGASKTNEAIFSINYRAYWHISAYYNPNNFYENGVNMWARIVPESNLLCFPRDASVTTNLVECTGPDDNWTRALERQRRSGQGRTP